MAEQVQYHLERMLPELRDLEERGVFSKVEIKSIVKSRTSFEYAIHRRITSKSDYLRYISYEINLEKLRKKRKHRLGLNQPANKRNGAKGITVSDYSIVQRIHSLYQKALKKFGGDVELWVEYLNWAQEIKSTKALGKSFARAIQLHPLKEVFWIMAAGWEFEENQNMVNARSLFQRALRLLNSSKLVWHEYFKLECLYLHKLLLRRKILMGADDKKEANDVKEGDSDNEDDDEDGTMIKLPSLPQESELRPLPLQSESAFTVAETLLSEGMTPAQTAFFDGAIPRAIYRNAIKEISKDLDFRLEFLSIYRKFEFPSVGQNEVYDSIERDFTTVQSKAALAQRYLWLDASNDPTSPLFPAALKKCVDAFEACFKDLPEIWQAYHDFVQDVLSRSDEGNMSKFLERLLEGINSRKP
ncbi:hypothetical protein SmJEL517_g00500 [Synchytrium microbalum]|uniref:U3 small nucleolar RNA-associated protein 6 N-terminal domain-containing protein n=1 Tax=Synchytrium microbalum TaxID=1806994 RepID=A0A507CDE4_9FUNG|nr:uncharacterized protein SmJEL517_g00500 [Synchytrium microbalum]TPX37521.1 hypothetical protein SmJEL517_g00500 [Synchytrium microbalum]